MSLFYWVSYHILVVYVLSPQFLSSFSRCDVPQPCVIVSPSFCSWSGPLWKCSSNSLGLSLVTFKILTVFLTGVFCQVPLMLLPVLIALPCTDLWLDQTLWLSPCVGSAFGATVLRSLSALLTMSDQRLSLEIHRCVILSKSSWELLYWPWGEIICHMQSPKISRDLWNSTSQQNVKGILKMQGLH